MKDGKEWVRVSRTLFKSQWRALLDGAELRELIQYRPSALLPAITMTAPTADGSHTGLSHAAEKTRASGRAGAGTLYAVPGVLRLPNFGIVRRRGRGGSRLKNIAVRAYKKLLLRGLLHRTG